MARNKTKQDETEQAPDFEQALGELEGIVQKMEDDQLPLQESLAHLKRGMELGKTCHRILDQAEQQVKMLVGKEGGHGLEEFVEQDAGQQDGPEGPGS